MTQQEIEESEWADNQLAAMKQKSEPPVAGSAIGSVDADVAKFKLPINLKHCGKLFKLMVDIHGKGALRMKQEGEWLVMFRESKQPSPPNVCMSHGGHK